jgi:transcriptional regulator with XRE-family HTH domain
MSDQMVGRQGNLEWAKNIADLRRTLQMTQTQLASEVGVTAMTVSRWERGLVEPTASGYIALGNLADPKQSWSFWRRAGLQEDKVRSSMRFARNGSRGSK